MTFAIVTAQQIEVSDSPEVKKENPPSFGTNRPRLVAILGDLFCNAVADLTGLSEFDVLEWLDGAMHGQTHNQCPPELTGLVDKIRTALCQSDQQYIFRTAYAECLGIEL